MCTATIGHATGADHCPNWSGGGPDGPTPATHAENGPSLFGEPVDQVDGSVVRFVCELVSADAPPGEPWLRKCSVPEPAGPSSAIQ